MNLIRTISRVLPLSLLSLFVASCGPVSEHPLSDPGKAKPDQRLYGQWKDEEKTGDGAVRNYFVGKPDSERVKSCPPGVMSAYFVEYRSNHEVRMDIWPGLFFVTRIGSDDYLNFVNDEMLREKELLRWNRKKVSGFGIAKYEISGDRLVIWEMDNDVTVQLVKAKKLKGEIHRDMYGVESVRLTDSSKNIREYIRQGGNKTLFKDKDKITFQRVKW